MYTRLSYTLHIVVEKRRDLLTRSLLQCSTVFSFIDTLHSLTLGSRARSLVEDTFSLFQWPPPYPFTFVPSWQNSTKRQSFRHVMAYWLLPKSRWHRLIYDLHRLFLKDASIEKNCRAGSSELTLVQSKGEEQRSAFVLCFRITVNMLVWSQSDCERVSIGADQLVAVSGMNSLRETRLVSRVNLCRIS